MMRGETVPDWLRSSGSTLCLFCGRKRVETGCGDQSCPCRGGRKFAPVSPVVIPGMSYAGHPEGTFVARCGRVVHEARCNGTELRGGLVPPASLLWGGVDREVCA